MKSRVSPSENHQEDFLSLPPKALSLGPVEFLEAGAGKTNPRLYFVLTSEISGWVISTLSNFHLYHITWQLLSEARSWTIASGWNTLDSHVFLLVFSFVSQPNFSFSFHNFVSHHLTLLYWRRGLGKVQCFWKFSHPPKPLRRASLGKFIAKIHQGVGSLLLIFNWNANYNFVLWIMIEERMIHQNEELSNNNSKGN